MELNYRQHSNGMYILGKNDIETIATNVLKELSPANLEKPIPLNIENLFDALGLIVKYAYLGIPGHEILGATIMDDFAEILICNIKMEPMVVEETFGTVLISSTLCSTKNIPRKRFTEAHEVSHWILHRPYFDHLTQDNNPRMIACRAVGCNNTARKNNSNWLEWQADTLAAALLMPQNVFLATVRQAVRDAGLLRSYIIEERDHDVFYRIIQPISKQFAVSQSAAEIRMRQLGLIQKQYAC